MSTLQAPQTTASGEVWLHANADWIVAYAFVLTGNRDDALDLAQDSMLKIIKAWRRVEQAASPKAYARRIVTNTFRSTHRRRRFSEQPLHLAPDLADPDATVDGVRVDIAASLRNLPARQRIAVVLRYWEDLDDDAIARTLGCRTGTVRSLLSRAKASLRATLGEEDE